MTPTEEAALVDMTREEAEALFEQRVQKYLGMSGDDFRALVEADEVLPDHPMVGHLLLMLGAGPDTN